MRNNRNIYQPVRATLEEVVEESPLIKTLVLRPETEFSFDTGQFIELTLNGYGEAPFTPSSSPFVKDRLEVTIMKAGHVTEKFHQLTPGEVLGIRGPYGRGYPVYKMYEKEVVIVSGGCGLAPIRSLLYHLMEWKDRMKRVVLCYGSKTPADCIYKPFFQELRAIPKFEAYRAVNVADETWTEAEGVVTVLLDKIDIHVPDSVAVVCGPPVMMKFATQKLLSMGFPEEEIYLSMEKNMSCGFGKCGHCMMGEFFVCKDGPVFSYDEIKHIPDIWK